MKLSDIKGERTLEVIAEIIDPIANIAEDEAAAELFRREKLPDGMTAKAFVLARVRKVLPALLKRRKRDVLSILASIEGTTPDEYASGLDMVKLVKDTADLLSDDVFQGLFISAQSGNQSGSASENTGGQKT